MVQRYFMTSPNYIFCCFIVILCCVIAIFTSVKYFSTGLLSCLFNCLEEKLPLMLYHFLSSPLIQSATSELLKVLEYRQLRWKSMFSLSAVVFSFHRQPYYRISISLSTPSSAKIQFHILSEPSGLAHFSVLSRL